MAPFKEPLWCKGAELRSVVGGLLRNWHPHALAPWRGPLLPTPRYTAEYVLFALLLFCRASLTVSIIYITIFRTCSMWKFLWCLFVSLETWRMLYLLLESRLHSCKEVFTQTLYVHSYCMVKKTLNFSCGPDSLKITPKHACMC